MRLEMTEIHLFIIWSKAVFKKDEIVLDISNKFVILDIIKTNWSKVQFSSNLTRFYGENLPKNSNKEKHCGNDEFFCVVVKDTDPIYEVRKTSKGYKAVNINLFDAKQLYRNWTGGGHKIHATDNIYETKFQLALLYGRSYSTYLKQEIVNARESEYSDDLVGSKGWQDFSSLFKILNMVTDYVVLRNFEDIEEQLNSLHPDVDVLVNNKSMVVSLLNAKETTNKKYRVQYDVSVAGKIINFDIRHVGDGYYDEVWEKEILKTRVLHEKGFYIPSKTNLFYSILYHAYIHKATVSKDYFEQFIFLYRSLYDEVPADLLVETNLLRLLDNFMVENRYSYTEPKDFTVYFNSKLLSNVTKIKLTTNREVLNFKLIIRSKIKMFIVKILSKLGYKYVD